MDGWRRGVGGGGVVRSSVQFYAAAKKSEITTFAENARDWKFIAVEEN